MGIYYQTILYYGFYTTDKSIKKQLEKSYYVEFNEGIIVFIPETLYTVKAVDCIIGENEIKQGYVLMSEVIRALNIDDKYFNVTDEQNKLLIQLANSYNIERNQVGIWTLESMMCTYEYNSLSSIIKKLHVV